MRYSKVPSSQVVSVQPAQLISLMASVWLCVKPIAEGLVPQLLRLLLRLFFYLSKTGCTVFTNFPIVLDIIIVTSDWSKTATDSISSTRACLWSISCDCIAIRGCNSSYSVWEKRFFVPANRCNSARWCSYCSTLKCGGRPTERNSTKNKIQTSSVSQGK